MLSTFLDERLTVLLCGAPYHPATNGMAERMVQNFKRHLAKNVDLTLDQSLQEFLIVYRRTPLSCGRSPAELLMGRQIRSYIDVLLPTKPVHQRQQLQVALAKKTKRREREFAVNSLIFAADYRRNNRVTWVPGKVLSRQGSRLYQVELDEGLVWTRHIDQLKFRP